MPSRKNLTQSQRAMAVGMLLQSRDEETGKLEFGCKTKVAGIFSVDVATVSRLWKHVVQNASDAGMQLNSQNIAKHPELTESRKSKCGRHKKWNREELMVAVKALPLNKRRTFRTMEEATGVPLGSIWRMTREENIFRVKQKQASKLKVI
jgi:hypothetical protein